MKSNAIPVKVVSDDENESGHEVYCTVKKHKGVKVYECTMCRYSSERRSNVCRHFGRIHCELKRHKQCVCDEIFLTKGEYYEHCFKEHPYLRHSSFITTEKYKIGKAKSNDGSKKRLVPVKNKEVRCSARLSASVKKYAKSISLQTVEKNNNDENVQSNVPVPVANVEQKSSKRKPVNVERLSTNNPLEIVQKNSNSTDNHLPLPIAVTQNMDIDIQDDKKWLEPSMDKENSYINYIKLLPPKKRFRSLRAFTDITNNNNIFGCNNNQFMKPSKTSSEPTKNAFQFIDQIDFDDLDAMLSLAHLKYFY